MSRDLRSVAFALLVLGASVAPVLVAAQGPGQSLPDLAVTSVRITGSAPNWTFDEPTNTHVEAKVKNVAGPGSGYRLIYEWRDAGGNITPLNEDETSSVDISDGGPILAGQERTHTAPWRLQPHEVGAGFLRVRVEPPGDEAGDARPSNNVMELSTFIPHYAVGIEIPGPDQAIHPDETRFFPTRLTNPGNVPVTVNLTWLRSIDPAAPRRLDQVAVEPSVLILPAGSRRDVPLLAHYPLSGDYSAFTAAFVVQANTSFGRNVTATSPHWNGDDQSWQPANYSFDVSRSPSGSLFVAPGSDTRIELRIRNLGTDQDVYRPSYQAAGGSVGFDAARVGVAPGQDGRLNATFHAPADAKRGALLDLTLRLASTHTSDPAEIVVPIRVSGPSVRLQDLRLRQDPPYKGDTGVVLLNVENRGDSPSAPETPLRLRARLPGGQELVREIRVGPLAPGAVQPFVFDLGVLSAGGPLGLTASWEGPGGDAPVAPAVASFQIHDPRLRVIAPAPLTGVPGELVAYRTSPKNFLVRNEGSLAETVRLGAAAAAGRAEVEGPAELVLEPGAERSVPVLQSLPLPAGRRDAANLTLEAAIQARPAYAWNATVRTGILDRNPPVLELQHPASLEWALGEPFPLRVAAFDDGAVRSVNATLVRPGATPIVVDLAVDQPGGDWHAEVRLPDAGTYSVVVRARDWTGNKAEAPAISVRVLPVPPPQILGLSELEGTALDPGLPLLIHVKDERAVQLRITTNRSDDAAASLQFPVVNGTASADLGGLAPGPVTLTLEAVNVAGARSNATLHVKLVPASDAGEGLTESPGGKHRNTPAVEAFGTLGALGLAWTFTRRRRA